MTLPTIKNWFAVSVSVLQIGAAIYEYSQGRPALGTMWAGLAVANFAVALV